MIGPWEGYIMDGFRVSIFCKEAMYVWRSSKICKVKVFFLISNSLPLHIYIYINQITSGCNNKNICDYTFSCNYESCMQVYNYMYMKFTIKETLLNSLATTFDNLRSQLTLHVI